MRDEKNKERSKDGSGLKAGELDAGSHYGRWEGAELWSVWGQRQAQSHRADRL